MTDDPSLEPLPDDVRQALQVERSRPALPLNTTASLVSRIEATSEFAVATGKVPMKGRLGVAAEAGRALRTPIGLALFLAGTLWGMALGATAVLLLRP